MLMLKVNTLISYSYAKIQKVQHEELIVACLV